MVAPSQEGLIMSGERSSHVSPDPELPYAGKGFGPLLVDDTQGTTFHLPSENLLDSKSDEKSSVNGKDGSAQFSLHALLEFNPSSNRTSELNGSQSLDLASQPTSNDGFGRSMAQFRNMKSDEHHGKDKFISNQATETSSSCSTSSGRELFPQTVEEIESAVENPVEDHPNLLASLPSPAKTHRLLRAKTLIKEDDLKKLILIPEYLSRGMAAAIGAEDPSYGEESPLTAEDAPDKPILVFINSRSGGRLGPELESLLVKLIAPCQGADAGDECALATRNNLRIMVAGGDGTVGWVLSTLAEVKLGDGFAIPPVGIIPLGTGNDLSRSFNWGGSFTRCTRGSVRRYLMKATNATVANLDSWQVVVKPAPSRKDVPLKLPHCMREQHHIPLEGTQEKSYAAELSPNFVGTFYNYFSVGMDAQVAYGFHHLREEAPWLARGRLSNQMVYSGYSCAQGWFCTACSTAPRARGIRNSVRVKVIRHGGVGEWEELTLPGNVKAILILNLQSYAGGRNPWGHPSASKLEQERFVEAKSDDGVLEVIGLREGWHTAIVMLELLGADRLAQATSVRLEMGGNRERAYLQMDGEPWQQPIGHADDEPAVVEISRVPSHSVMLSRWKTEG